MKKTINPYGEMRQAAQKAQGRRGGNSRRIGSQAGGKAGGRGWKVLFNSWKEIGNEFNKLLE